jgi:hypothetical protein
MVCNNAEMSEENGTTGTATEKALLLLADQVSIASISFLPESFVD